MRFDPNTGQEPGSGPSGSGKGDDKSVTKRWAIGIGLAVAAVFIIIWTLPGCP